MEKPNIGKRNEFSVWARLLEYGIDVYPSLVDDKKIDGLIGLNGHYFEVQIKSGKEWNRPRGFSYEICKKNPNRIFIIYNYTKKAHIFLTGEDILKEKEWKETTRWDLPQLKWNKKILEKYSSHDFDGLIRFLKSKVRNG
ncbi:MAG: hypothetical protein AB1324_04015 [Candidatus Micrarchaeota archaeon]